jgi:hypothetical protein
MRYERSGSGGGIGGGDREELLTDLLVAARARSWCRQLRGTTARQRAFQALGRFGSMTRPQGRARHVTSDATGTWPATRPKSGPVGTAKGGLGGLGDTCRTFGPQIRSRKRASERKRLRCGER